MAGHSKSQKADLVRAFVSVEADEDISEEEDSSEETELDLSERKRQTAESIPLPSAKQPSRLDLLLDRLNAEIEARTHDLATLPRPSEFLPESPHKKRRIARSNSPEESSRVSETSVDAGTSWDAAFAANPGSRQDFIDGLQLGRDLDEILAHYSGSQSHPNRPTALVSAPDQDEEEDRRFEWERFRSWVNVVSGGTAELFEFGIYYVRCRRGREAAIVKRICHDIEVGHVNREILRNASLAALPGGIYIQARSMLPGNHVLASYLRTCDGFIYPNAPRDVHPGWTTESIYPRSHYEVSFIANSPTLQLPKHHLVVGLNAYKGWLHEQRKDQFRIGTWVTATRGRYKGDCGLIVEDDYHELDSSERMVLFIPRIRFPNFRPNAESAAAEPPKKVKSSRRPSPVHLVGAGAILQMANKFKCKLKVECIEHCNKPETCAHQEINRKRVTFQGQTTRGGLALTVQNISTLKLAETLPDDLVMSFSKVDSVDILKTWMPPPSSWSFECGEEVAAVPFDGGTLALEFAQEVFCELSIEDASQREGKLLEILPLYCRVEFVGQRERAVPYHFLRKKMRLGDTVQLLAGVRPIKEITRTPVESTVVNMIRSEVIPLCGKQGLVVAVSDRTVDVWIPEIATTLSLHPNTLRNLSLNTIAVPFIPWPPFAKFHIGNNEQAIPTNPLNLVLNQSQELDTVSSSAEPGLSRLPYFTGKSPWEDILVTPVGRLQRKGYRGWVKEVKQDEKRISGIAVLIEYQTSNMTDSPREWFDYDVLRRCDNHRFIHDDYMGEQRAKTQHKGVTYYDFKEGYVPKYTLEEEKEAYVLQKERSKAEERQHQMHQRHIYVNEILAQSDKTRSQWINERQELLRQAGVDLIRDETTGLYYLSDSMITDASSQTPNPYINDSRHESIDLSRASSPTPLPSVSSHWLLDPRIREGLGDNDLLLAFKGEKKDRRVCLRVINGLTEAYSAIGHKRPIQVQDLVEDFRSYGVTKPFRAAGLYLVCEGDHIGKLVRRASEYYGNNGELYKDPLWTVQVVSVVKENGKFVETIMMDYPRFHLRGASLAEVHESRERRTSGNAAMTVLREQRDHVYTNGFWTDDDGVLRGLFFDNGQFFDIDGSLGHP
ncbi:hypothetical protein BT96DRAFT_944159 [Gymnopus androsaceus JB14]|uniref:Chromatin elongation factor spt5 n=1 Tax=Gymnopus androsaceus JB14 TaxID=1447944 RepID=A0A6A4H5Z1_9AGAR|nr:hypothetical protein BT96DRAFT_944159 [Gymnopus androsaceus JB14]